MLKHTLLHPEILHAIARAGHHGRILLADGNYPASTLARVDQLVREGALIEVEAQAVVIKPKQ